MCSQYSKMSIQNDLKSNSPIKKHIRYRTHDIAEISKTECFEQERVKILGIESFL